MKDRSHIPNSRKFTRKGFTLTELMVSLFAFGILISGLMSVLVVSTQTLQLGTSSAAQTSKSAQISSKILGEIVLAKRFVERSRSAVEFSTSDRDGDGLDEYIRFEYLPSPENQIVKTTYFTDSERIIEETIAEEVTRFDFTFFTQGSDLPSESQVRTSHEKLLFSHDLSLHELSSTPPKDPPANFPGIAGGLPGLPALSKKALLVVADPGALDPHETKVSSLMASCGVTVEIIDDSALPSEFDTELSRCDFLYLSRSIDPRELGNKVRETTVGILNESIGLCESLGFGESSPEKIVGHFLEWVQDSTPILDSSVAGASDFFEIAQTLDTISSAREKHSPSLRMLARTADKISMACLETGDEAYLGDSSPPTKYGFDTEFSNQSFPFKWNHVGTRCTVEQSVVAKRISVFNFRETASTLRFGIYTNRNGKPGSLLAETDFQSLSSTSSGEWTTLDLQTETELPPGDYWIVASVFGSVKLYYQGGGSTRSCLTFQSIYDGMMNNWGFFHDYGYPVKLSMYVTCNQSTEVNGRRMFVPWSGADVDLDAFSQSGMDIFRKCLQWCATPKDESDESIQQITDSQPVSQYFLPEWDSPVSQWNVSRISLFLRPLPSGLSTHFRVSVYQADPRGKPSTRLVAQSDWLSTDSLDGEHFRWWTVPVDEFDTLSSTTGICVTLETDSPNPALEIVADHNTARSNSHLSKSSDRGSSWQNTPTGENLRIYVFGHTGTTE